MNREEENDLVMRAQQGDKEAFRLLVRLHQRRVFHVCLGVVKSAADAEDVTQEVFIRVYKSLDKFEHNAKFSTWLYRIAHNASIDRLRKRNRRAADNFDDFVDENRENAVDDSMLSTPLGFDPRHAAKNAELRACITKAFESLSPAHRQILILREVEDLSYAEIAEILGIQKGTVMSRLHHARLNAQQYLREHYPEYASDG